MINNLKQLPKIYYINMDRSKDRDLYMLKQFKKYNIKNFERVSGTDYLNTNIEDISFQQGSVSDSNISILHSHLKSIKKFVDSEEDYAIIVEDDVDFSTSEYWSFTWEDIFNQIRDKVDILQLCISTRINMDINFHLHNRSFWDFNCTAYLIKRDAAKLVLDKFFINDKIDLSKYEYRKVYDKDSDNKYTLRVPVNEEVIYSINKDRVYSMPLFTYNEELVSLIHPDHYTQSQNSKLRVLDFWQNTSKTFTLSDLLY